MDFQVFLSWLKENWLFVSFAIVIIYYMRKNGKQIRIIAQIHEQSTNNIFRFLQENNSAHNLINHQFKDNQAEHLRLEKSIESNTEDIRTLKDTYRRHETQINTLKQRIS